MTTLAPTPSRRGRSALPRARGPLSEAVVQALAGSPPAGPFPVAEVTSADPCGDDLAVALHLCYELHYRGFEAVADSWEWDPQLIELRGAMERHFLAALRDRVEGGDDVAGTLDALLVEQVPGSGVTHHLRDAGTWWQLREYVVHRSVYHLKEADPQVWVIPRLRGHVKAALVAVEYDEYGGGRGERLHADLFAGLMEDLGLSADYLHYFDHVPAPIISIVNLMSLFGLHRELRGAMVGQFASVEITSSPSARRMARAVERLGGGPRALDYFTEHIEADAVHEQVMRRDVIDGLLADEPELAPDVVLGVQATELLEARLADHLLAAWGRGETSLLTPLPGLHTPG